MTKDAARTPETQAPGSPGTPAPQDTSAHSPDTGGTDGARTDRARTDRVRTDAGGTDAGGTDSASVEAATEDAASARAATEDTTARVWRGMAALVLEQSQGRKEVVEALGMSFFRIKALRRIAARPSCMSELATRLGTDRPYLSLVVDDLVKRGLVERHQHPTDRRSKIVKPTPEGRAAADRANAIMSTPPPGLAALPPEDLAALDRILTALTTPQG